MNNISYQQFIVDEAYNDGFEAGKKAAARKYDKLFNASKAWFHVYESAFGTPEKEGNPEYWELRKLLKMPE